MDDIKYFEQWLLTLLEDGVNITPPLEVDTKLGDWDSRLAPNSNKKKLPLDFEWK